MSKTRIERKLRVGVTGVAFAWNWFHHLQAAPSAATRDEALKPPRPYNPRKFGPDLWYSPRPV